MIGFTFIHGSYDRSKNMIKVQWRNLLSYAKPAAFRRLNFLAGLGALFSNCPILSITRQSFPPKSNPRLGTLTLATAKQAVTTPENELANGSETGTADPDQMRLLPEGEEEGTVFSTNIYVIFVRC